MLLLAYPVDGYEDDDEHNDHNVNSKRFESEIQVLIHFYCTGLQIMFFG